jgi:hypothetical protein
MKSLFSKAMVLIAGVAAFLGISVTNVAAPSPASASVTSISSKAALYLEHGKQIFSNMAIENRYRSHHSHHSHRSHYSGH